MKLPGKNILILAALCLSAIGALSAYQLASYARVKAEQTNLIASADNSAINGSSVNGSNKIMSALEQAAESQLEATTSLNPFAPSSSDTMTDRLSKSFFTAYAQTEANNSSVDPATGQPLDPASDAANKASLVNSALATVDTSTLPKQKYTTGDIATFVPTTSGDFHAYGNTFISIQNNTLKKIADNPAVYKNNIRAIGSVYTSLGEQLMHMKVPISLAQQHVEIANDFILSADTFILIDQQSKDPMKALLALRIYKDATERQAEMYTEIANYFRSSGILFDKTEAGYSWSTMPTQTPTISNINANNQ